jgi:hypothetical protein
MKTISGPKEIKLTKTMKSQLLEYIEEMGFSGNYWGDIKQFYKRHEKIKQWVLKQEVKK